MSIRTEPEARLQKSYANQSEEEQNLELEAEKMINEFIIPKFRKISMLQPTLSFLRIEFHINTGCWHYTSNIDSWEKRKKSPYSYYVVSKAVKIAKFFDIEAEKTDDFSCGYKFSFTLDLEKKSSG